MRLKGHQLVDSRTRTSRPSPLVSYVLKSLSFANSQTSKSRSMDPLFKTTRKRHLRARCLFRHNLDTHLTPRKVFPSFPNRQLNCNVGCRRMRGMSGSLAGFLKVRQTLSYAHLMSTRKVPGSNSSSYCYLIVYTSWPKIMIF